MGHWLGHWLGTDNPAGAVYLFLSGSGSVILPPLFSGLVIALLFWWHHQCGVHRCYWYARRATAAGERACWHHHPEPRRTHAEVIAAHHAAKPTRPPKRLARTQETGTTGNARPGGEP